MTAGSSTPVCAHPACDRTVQSVGDGAADGPTHCSVHRTAGPSADDPALDLQAIEPETYPADLVEVGKRWLLWQSADGRKVPRNPQWGRSDADGGYAYTSPKDPTAWHTFDSAAEWAAHESELDLAYYLLAPTEAVTPDGVACVDDSDAATDTDARAPPAPAGEAAPDGDTEGDVDREPHVGLLDFDDIRDPETGEVAPVAAAWLERLAGTFLEWSPSGTGAHALGSFTLPESISALTIDLSSPTWPDASLELYPGGRFTTVTGDHIPGSATETRDVQGVVDELLAEHPGAVEAARASRPRSCPAECRQAPETSAAAVADTETTTEMQVIFDAIHHVDPGDIRLRSTVTNERPDGTVDLDPSWTHSESGTRLAALDDGWVYREGMIGLDALQVVALEERIITSPDEYPSDDAFWAAVDALRDRGAHIPEYEGPSEGDPVSALPLDRLDALHDADQRERAAAERDIEWPSTDEARDRLRDRLFDALRHEEQVIIDAPTGLGKSYGVASEPWLHHADVTGEQPVVHLSPTREARDTAAEHSREASGVTHAVLRGRHEACPTAHGIHDPVSAGGDPETAAVTMGGTPASEWFDTMCDERGVPFSTAHAYLADNNDQDIELPCARGDDPCPAIAQWEGIPRTEEGDPAVDVIHATHQFAYVPGLVQHCNVVMDEQPEFTVDGDGLSMLRLQRAITEFLREAGAPLTDWAELVTIARRAYGRQVDDDLLRVAQATESALEYEPAHEWYFENHHAHTLAPALARAIWSGAAEGFDANGRAVGTVTHTPPRLDAEADETESWARSWVTVVIDDTTEVQTIRAVPDFSDARSLVGLDAHPSVPLWERNTTTDIVPDRVLDATERRLWRRYERGLRVVQVGDAVRPLASGEYFTPDVAEVVLGQLRDHYGDRFDSCITAASVESRVERLMHEVGIDDPATMHFGEERSRDDFGDRDVGLVHGSIDPGDDYVLNLLAECGLHAEPETVETDAGEERRAHGRGFVGPDADTAKNLLASVRETHVAQAAGRYARNASDPDDGAVVFVHTSAVPVGFADCEAPGVQWTASEAQQQVLEALRERETATARELAEATGVSKRHVARTLARLHEDDCVECRENAGAYGATLYELTESVHAGVADLGVEEITTAGVWDSYTWAVAIDPAEVARRPRRSLEAPPSSLKAVSLAAFMDGPPPE